MKGFGLSLLLAGVVASVHAQQPPFDRLPTARLDVVAPSARVTGAPGAMAVRSAPCRPVPAADVRRRIVDVAVQEWAFFGSLVIEQPTDADNGADNGPDSGPDNGPDDQPRPRRGRRRVDPVEGARVAASIGGYWSVTPAGSWIIGRQNDEWNGPDGLSARWNAPWSAAFTSWVMCEGGLGSATQFQRAVAHHAYIDQAIRARDAGAPQSAFIAYDAGEAAVEPGDLLCSARRPAYRTLAERRRQMGDGARTHCDVVVKVDAARQQVRAIGGNVRGAVSLKVLALTGRRGPALFAHLKLRAPSIEPDALDNSPTMRAQRVASR